MQCARNYLVHFSLQHPDSALFLISSVSIPNIKPPHAHEHLEKYILEKNDSCHFRLRFKLGMIKKYFNGVDYITLEDLLDTMYT